LQKNLKSAAGKKTARIFFTRRAAAPSGMDVLNFNPINLEHKPETNNFFLKSEPGRLDMNRLSAIFVPYFSLRGRRFFPTWAQDPIPSGKSLLFTVRYSNQIDGPQGAVDPGSVAAFFRLFRVWTTTR
jgi:hypothetical protein